VIKPKLVGLSQILTPLPIARMDLFHFSKGGIGEFQRRLHVAKIQQVVEKVPFFTGPVSRSADGVIETVVGLQAKHD
jgi:hypothetical protein